jgi:hypothetical protein
MWKKKLRGLHVLCRHPPADRRAAGSLGGHRGALLHPGAAPIVALRKPIQGRLGLLSLAIPARVVPAVIMGGLYYGFAGGRACPAHVSDLAIFVLLAIFVATS